MSDYKIFSADSHVSEPGDLWVERIEEKYRFRAPRLDQRERNGKLEDLWIYEGWPPHPVGVGLGAADRNGPGASTFRAEGKGYGDALSGGWDPGARLKDQDVDGVEGEVLYTTLGFRLYWVADAGLQRAMFRVYNDWLAEFCSFAPSRLVGLALISLYDVDEAIVELRRAAKLGHRGAMIFLSPPAGYPAYTSKVYDPFWAEAQELDMAMVLHENTGGAESRTSPSSYWDEDLTLGVTITRPHEVQRSLGGMILSGVFERNPRLRVITAENGTDWLPWFLNRLKRRPRTNSYPTTLTMSPLDYWYRNCYATYINENEAVQHRDLIGVDNLLFATDYPHSASTWPKSQEIVERDMQGVTEADRRKLIHDNTMKAFGLRAAVPA